MARYICLENCRIHAPEDLRGDYVRGQDVWDSRLHELYPALFSEIISLHGAATLSPVPVFVPEETEVVPIAEDPIPEGDPSPTPKKGARAPAMS